MMKIHRRYQKKNDLYFTRDVYRDQLVTFVETGLNKNLQSRLSPSICGRVEAKQHDIISRLVKEYHEAKSNI